MESHTDPTFKISEHFGLYFDDPNITTPSKCRSVIGLMVNPGEEQKIEAFLKQYPQYERKHLKATRSYSTELPFVNSLSFIVMVYTIYPKMKKFIEDISDDKTILNPAKGFMEVYNFQRSDKKIQIHYFI